MARPAFIAAVLATGILAGCAGPQAYRERREHLLSAAGFQLLPATRPDVAARLSHLPPHRLVWQDHAGKLTFLYADPEVCRCLFVGSEANYQAYRRMQFQRHVVAQSRAAAQMNLNAATWGPGWGSGWGPWGMPSPYGWW
jgi:hypothetical protein